MEKFDNLIELLDRFPDELSARKYFENLLWKNGEPVCPHCKNEKKIYRYKNGKSFKCNECKKQFAVTVGTVFEGSHVPLRKWFVALYLFSAHKKGVSSIQLSKAISVSQKTAWFMLQRIRYMINSPAFQAPLEGVVEVDETYVGGLAKFRHYKKRKQVGRSRKEKIKVFGMLQRGGHVRSMCVPDVSRHTLRTIIYENIEPASTVMSDEWWAYRTLSAHYTHRMVEHGKYQYVDGDCYTNTLEGYWSHLKRTIRGTYHWISHKHADRYCSESDFRYNTRHQSDQSRFNIALGSQANGRLTYAQLTKGGKLAA